MRLFVGSFLDETLVNIVPFDEITLKFSNVLKPVKRENIHITWVFLGNVLESDSNEIENIVEKYIPIFKNLAFKSTCLEFWPLKKSPRLIALTGKLYKDSNGNQSSIELDLRNLIQELKTICNPDIKQDFIPHLTIARFKKDKTIKISELVKLPRMQNFDWNIKEISLIESILSSEGPIYKKLKTWSL